eukprot:Gregarina_sp_Pseudo_9__2185@NODE_2530_length_966_cov_34_074434_g2323_i0_p2_GENE_NODE_2530_length_966_cov_34_074434_g2323_i0NODE_2530_length_966_cov_34_074434_g2323_i0_p2_ORF_typecomplete_len213_score25_52zfMYND/PF01753_18/1_4e04zfMYND/PF01753_18/2_4e10DUF3330/PF11809_8/0_0012_NODE_2530_length_966_cov_34_074434_g2323_i0224862
MSTLNDLSNACYCPTFSQLPPALVRAGESLPPQYVWIGEGVCVPCVHWITLGEITALGPAVSRLQDRDGTQIDLEFRPPVSLPHGAKVGDTLVIFYPEHEPLVSGQRGIKLRDPRSVKLVHFPVSDIFALVQNLRSGSEECDNCGTKAPPHNAFQRCGRCYTAHYCSRACQLEHWTKVHKSKCTSLREIRALLKMNFASFSDFFAFENDGRP